MHLKPLLQNFEIELQCKINWHLKMLLTVGFMVTASQVHGQILGANFVTWQIWGSQPPVPVQPLSPDPREYVITEYYFRECSFMHQACRDEMQCIGQRSSEVSSLSTQPPTLAGIVNEYSAWNYFSDVSWSSNENARTHWTPATLTSLQAQLDSIETNSYNLAYWHKLGQWPRNAQSRSV